MRGSPGSPRTGTCARWTRPSSTPRRSGRRRQRPPTPHRVGRRRPTRGAGPGRGGRDGRG
ncbi:hypothetical protein C6A88_08285 [Mycolicibacterium austroafricanum]|nr:hypothetical protein C6A88_08285 [Mycolicibacterium austroafricanum]